MTTDTSATDVRTPSMFDLAGRVVIVTGGGSGIGRVYVQHLVAAGARVVIADIAAEAAANESAQIVAAGGAALATHTDIADEASTVRMAESAMAAYGRIDALINNAAIMNALPRGPWLDISVDDWDLVMNVNLRGTFLCCKAVYPYMKRQGGGRIVNTSSNRVLDGTPNRLHYTTSKAGVIGLTRALAREVGDDNITVNVITPGYTASETQLAQSTDAYRQQMAALNQRKCIKRTQVPTDLVGAVLFLVSDASAYITGQTLNVDGGFLMH